MERSMLLHLHPTAQIIGKELQKAGVPCVLRGEVPLRRFRGVSPYRGGNVQADVLYLLMPGDEEHFPLGDGVYLCSHPVSEDFPHLYCPGQEPAALLGVVLELFSWYQQWEIQLDELVYRRAGPQELCELGAGMLRNPVCIHDDWFVMIANSSDLPEIMAPEHTSSSNKMLVPQSIVE